MGKLSDRRMARVTSLLRRTLSEIISGELKDPRIGIFSLTDIQLSRDLSYAKVKVSVVGDPPAAEECCKVLEAATPLLWNRLREETDLRKVPRLHFVPDRSGEYHDRITRLLQEIPQTEETPTSIQEDPALTD